MFEKRRSIRKYKKNAVPDKLVMKVLEAARWAPSGLNNQPWRFKILKDADKDGLAQFTECGDIIKNAPVAVCVFLDKKSSYHREKDIMALGACIQNMLLQAYALGLGTCWCGEILNKKSQAQKYLAAPRGYELMAVITIGYPAEKPKSMRKSLKPLLFT